MKKYLAIMMCAGLLFTATGCGEKKEEDSSKDDTKVEEKAKDETKDEKKVTNKILSCTQEDENSDPINVTFTYDLEGKTFSKAVLNTVGTMPTSDTLTDEDYQEFVSTFCENYASDEMYKKCDAKLQGDKLSVTVEINIDKIDEEAAGYGTTTPIDELKEIMEDDDVTCTIEEK